MSTISFEILITKSLVKGGRDSVLNQLSTHVSTTLFEILITKSLVKGGRDSVLNQLIHYYVFK